LPVRAEWEVEIMPTNKRFRALMFAACCLAITPNFVARVPAAQTVQQSDEVVFEVASIRVDRTESNVAAQSRVSPGGRFTATKMSARDLILRAYDIERFQLVGGPPWIASERFDISASATGELTTGGERPTLPGALRTLLKQRFKLVEHTELREFPVYALRVVREGRLGPNISPSDVDCAVIRCTTVSPGFGAEGRYSALSAPITRFIGSVRPAIDRYVIDETGLKGNFKIDLRWTPTMPPVPPTPSPDLVAPNPSETASIFTAIQEQLGLKLVPTTAPIRVIVIDAIEPPRDN
jgi:uncharacterized protein (TIGR03435 family)